MADVRINNFSRIYLHTNMYKCTMCEETTTLMKDLIDRSCVHPPPTLIG